MFLALRMILGKISPRPWHEDAEGGRGTAPLILNLGTRLRWVIKFKPRPLYPRGRTP